jgi:hypothetical protein
LNRYLFTIIILWFLASACDNSANSHIRSIDMLGIRGGMTKHEVIQTLKLEEVAEWERQKHSPLAQKLRLKKDNTGRIRRAHPDTLSNAEIVHKFIESGVSLSENNCSLLKDKLPRRLNFAFTESGYLWRLEILMQWPKDLIQRRALESTIKELSKLHEVIYQNGSIMIIMVDDSVRAKAEEILRKSYTNEFN